MRARQNLALLAEQVSNDYSILRETLHMWQIRYRVDFRKDLKKCFGTPKVSFRTIVRTKYAFTKSGHASQASFLYLTLLRSCHMTMFLSELDDQ